MPKLKPEDPSQSYFCFAEPIQVPQGDGSVLLKPGKPIHELTVKQAARILHLHTTTVYEYIDIGLLPARRPSPRKIILEYSDVFALRKKSKDPEFWSSGPGQVLYQYRARKLSTRQPRQKLK